LDYWKHISLHIYESMDEFFKKNKDKEMVFLSSHGVKDHWSVEYKDDLFLVFGKESVGLPKSVIEQHPEKLFKIPMFSAHIRSLNLANAVSVVVYEGLRHLK